MQDIRNKNMVFMKFGREYIQPSTEQIKEYDNTLTEILDAENQQNTFPKIKIG